RRGLYDPIADRGYAERPLTRAPRFRNHHSFDRSWFVAFGANLLPHYTEPAVHAVFFDARERFSIDARRPTVRTAARVGVREEVFTPHLVIQRVEPPRRLLEFPGFSGQTLASGFSRRSYAEVQAPDPWESAIGLRIHQGASRSVQRADDVSRSRGCPERLLRLALAAPLESRPRGRAAASPDSSVVCGEPRYLRRSPRLPRSA